MTCFFKIMTEGGEFIQINKEEFDNHFNDLTLISVTEYYPNAIGFALSWNISSNRPIDGYVIHDKAMKRLDHFINPIRTIPR